MIWEEVRVNLNPRNRHFGANDLAVEIGEYQKMFRKGFLCTRRYCLGDRCSRGDLVLVSQVREKIQHKFENVAPLSRSTAAEDIEAQAGSMATMLL